MKYNIARFYICIKSCSWQVIGHRGSRCVGGHIPGTWVSPGEPEPGENVMLPALSVHGNVWRWQQRKIRCHHNRKGKQRSVLYINCVNSEMYSLIDTFIYLSIALKSVHLWRNGIICQLIVFRVERTRNQRTWLLTGKWREKTESRHCFTWSRWIFWGFGIHQLQK